MQVRGRLNKKQVFLQKKKIFFFYSFRLVQLRFCFSGMNEYKKVPLELRLLLDVINDVNDAKNFIVTPHVVAVKR